MIPIAQDIWNAVKPFILSIIILVITFSTAKILAGMIKRAFKKSSKLIKTDPTKYTFMRHFLTAMVYLVGIGVAIYLIPPLRSLSISLFAGAGILAVVIGFASQHAFANIISGIFIVIFKPYKVGDKIKIGTDVSGTVEDISLRHTIIRTFENKRMVIPNSVISNEKIENATMGEEEICKYIEIGISYDSDINKAMKIMKEEAEKHPLCIDHRSKEDIKNNEPKVAVRVLGFGDSSVDLRAWAWAKDQTSGFLMGCDLNKSIKERFDKESIEIPFPYRTIVMKQEKKKK
jgi:small-conductance mechanosensitive channel